MLKVKLLFGEKYIVLILFTILLSCSSDDTIITDGSGVWPLVFWPDSSNTRASANLVTIGSDGQPVFVVTSSKTYLCKIDINTGDFIWKKEILDNTNSQHPDITDIISLIGGGYALIGHNNSHRFLFKYDINGLLVWKKEYLVDFGRGSIDLSLDENLITLTHENNFRILISKIDQSSGDVIWESKISDSSIIDGSSFSVSDVIKSTIEEAYYFLYLNGKLDGYFIAKVNGVGDLIWHKGLESFNDWSQSYDDLYFHNLTISKSEMLVATGEGEEEYGGLIQTFNSRGELVGDIRLDNEFGFSKARRWFDVIVTNDNKIIATGKSNSFDGILVAKFTFEGELIWEKTFIDYKGNRLNGDGLSLAEFSDGSIVLSGGAYTLTSDWGEHAFIVRLTANGEIFE